jgi:pimeloyl-ACP methyl ester carboxylesterase
MGGGATDGQAVGPQPMPNLDPRATIEREKEGAMRKVTSKDGTEIAFERSGTGAALILVGGALADHTFYTPLSSELTRHFTVYNFDRRGRGQSGDTPPYAVEREVEDLASLIAYAKEPVFLYGHSAGSALALRSAASGLNIAKLALADPPFTPRGVNEEAAKAEHSEQATHVQELNDKGDYKASIKFFLKDYGLSEEDLEAMFQSPAGEGMLDCARALPYDYAVLGDGLVPTELATKVNIPTLILAAAAMPETAQALTESMPNARFQAMEASAHELPPADIAAELLRFFLR